MNEEEKLYYSGEAKFSPIPLTVSSPVIKAIDKNKLTAQAVETMHRQASQQIDVLRRQAELLIAQVKEIESRLQISELIYKANIRFKPVIGETYHLYKKESDEYTISIIAPKEWGRTFKQTFIASVKLLGDSSWDILEKNEEDFSHFMLKQQSNRGV